MQKDMIVLDLIVSKINKYHNKSIYISDLIYDLESYLNQLTVVGREWKKNFRTVWLDIEIAYSLALDQGLDKPVNEGDVIVVNALTILKKMAHEEMETLKTNLSK